MPLCPIILAGGAGTRLWPLSRAAYPKQFIRLFNEHSMLQNTLLRLNGLEAELELMPPWIVCNEKLGFLVADQIDKINIESQGIILEPEGRNTAPALTIAALMQTDADAILLMMPADHVISDVAGFQSRLKTAYHLARRDYLIAFGIAADSPETGYGYIERGPAIDTEDNAAAFSINAFKEKPAKAVAAQYIDSGDHLWNSGIFMMRASLWCAMIRRFDDHIYQACQKAHRNGTDDGRFFHIEADSFLSCRADSVDYAVMEPLAGERGKFAVCPLNVGWSDIGTWSSVWQFGDKDPDGNCIKGGVITGDVRNSIIRSEHRSVAALGVRDLVIVETADSVLVADKDKSQDVRLLAEQFETDGGERGLLRDKVHRPWGSYQTIDTGERFQVKRIIVNPGKRLSLQYHHKRSEHWTVVEGTATVTRGEESFDLATDQSTHIPLGVKHRLENRTAGSLQIIEIQLGEYLGEDDIVRLEDDFGRN